MNLATDFPGLGRVAAVAALLGFAACPADEPNDGEEDTDATGPTLPTTTTTATTTTTTATTTSASTADESSSDSTDPGTGIPDVDYTTDIQPVWIANCVTGCHEPGGLNGTLDLSLAFASHTSLVGGQKPLYSVEPTFVVPGDTADSFLIDALRHPPGTLVRQMPLGIYEADLGPVAVEGEPLPESTIQLVELWIQRGADP